MRRADRVIINKPKLERLYRRYNRRELVHPDPLEFLYRYPAVKDMEIVGLIASSLAYGRVAQILKSVDAVLSKIGKSPRRFVERSSPKSLARTFAGFKHRFTTDDELVSLLAGIRRVIGEFDTLNRCFVAGMTRSDADVLPALGKFVGRIGCKGRYLLPDPDAGSGCKRLNLFLRWMVRCDAVDPGGWEGVATEKLIIPLDTHMAKIGRAFRLTARNSPSILMARDITTAFKQINSKDPVKYDFVLTRFGIRNDMDMGELMS